MTINDQLKPLPCCMCGGPSILSGEKRIVHRQYVVGCKDPTCATSGPYRYQQAEAIAAWNALMSPVVKLPAGRLALSPDHNIANVQRDFIEAIKAAGCRVEETT